MASRLRRVARHVTGSAVTAPVAFGPPDGPAEGDELALLEEVLVGADAYGVVERLFNEYDVDGSGAIDEDELHAFLSDVSELSRGHRNVSRAELRAVLEEIDGNGDGQVDLEELRVYVAGAGTVELISARVGLPTR